MAKSLNIVAIVQARCNSLRLPNKVLKRISKMKIKVETIILSILWVASIYSIFVTSTTEYKLSLSNYIAFISLIGLTGLKLFKIKKFLWEKDLYLNNNNKI